MNENYTIKQSTITGIFKMINNISFEELTFRNHEELIKYCRKNNIKISKIQNY